ncbi:MAG: hypothetical protein AAGF11_56170 [Myxococcota bacterium]
MAYGTNGWRSLLVVALLTACPSGDEPSLGGDSTSTSSDDSQATGGAEETAFGMGDDLPLATDIPEIKQGQIPSGKRVELRAVVLSSPEGQIDQARSYFVRDPAHDSFAGLRVAAPPVFETPSGEFPLDLVGTAVFDDRREGWTLSLEQLFESRDPAPSIEPIVTELTVIAPGGSQREALADMLVRLDDPEGKTLWISAQLGNGFELSEQLVVDLEPFGVRLDPPPVDTSLASVTGLVLLEGDRTVLLPRSDDDLRF